MASGKIIYLAIPYSSKNPILRWWRFIVASRCAAALMNNGYQVFSPISHSHNISLFLPRTIRTDHEFWLKQDFPILKYCAVVVVVTVKGWRLSRGVNKECYFASRQNPCIRQIYLSPKQIYNGDYPTLC